MNVKASQFGNDSKPERILFIFYASNDLPNNVLDYWAGVLCNSVYTTKK
jgi:hypothetical protein